MTSQTEANFWKHRVTYTVQRPNAFAGNIFKTQSAFQPNVNFTLTVKR